MCGASSGARRASTVEAASQPQLRPITSITKMRPRRPAMARRSSPASRIEVARYLPAEPKPGEQSVPSRSLSTVLGTPTQVSG